MEKQKNAVGRRKEAVTRIFLSKGDGKITVNGKDYKVYFPLVYLQNQVEAPLKTVDSADKFDVVVNAVQQAPLVRIFFIELIPSLCSANPCSGFIANRSLVLGPSHG